MIQNPSYLASRRLRLIPATLTLVRAELYDQRALAHLLNARVPEDWPPLLLEDALPLFLARLEEDESLAGWLSWYWVRGAGIPNESEGEPAVLIGSGGFTGPPDNGGNVEIGYSVLDQYQGRGYATEALSLLVDWAFSHSAVLQITADTTPTNAPSQRVLEKLGFHRVGTEPDKGMIRYILESTPSAADGESSLQK